MGSLSHLRESASTLSIQEIVEVWKNKGGLTDREWNAFIGIVTAIVGNILISFALNLQRYAHIRLDRDRLRRQKSWRSGKIKQVAAAKNLGYGTQMDVAEQRANVNREAPPMDEEDPEHQAAYHYDQDESDPLVGERRNSHSSGSTAMAESQGDFKAKNYLKSGWWWAGIILMTTGEAGNFLAYGFAPASIVSPLGVVAIISNCIIAPCLLKEKFRQRDFWGVVIAIGGTVTIVLSAENNEAKLGPHKIWQLITRWEFELYLGITTFAIIVLMWASGRYGQKSIVIDVGLVGLFGGYTALTTKGIASLLSDTLWRVITFPVTYLLLFILIFTAVMQIRYINRALQHFDSTQVIPTQFVLFTLSVILGSAVLYRDFETASAARYGKFIGGCALTFLGVYCITSGRKRSADDEHDFTDDEDGIRLVDEEAQDYYASPIEDLNGASKIQPGQPTYTDDQSTALSRAQSNISSTGPRTPKRMTSDPSSLDSGSFEPHSSSSPLGENPWLAQESGKTPSNPSLLTPSVTEPISNRHSIAGTSLLRQTSSRPSTPTRHTQVRSQSNLTLPRSGSTIDERRSMSRKSMSHMLPGPLISPLSNSLSGIVQDSLRRGIDSPTGGSMRSKRRSALSRLRAIGVSEDGRASPGRASERETVLPFPSQENGEGAEGDGERVKKKRSQSLSDTLGGFLGKMTRSKKSLRDDEEEADDPERRGTE